jgi:Uma2 family endonuclease
MATNPPAPYHTARMIIDAPADGRRYEVVWGERLVTVTVSVEHQRLILRILSPLSRYCEHLVGVETVLGPADITWSEDTLVKPDIFVMLCDEAHSEDWSGVKTLPFVAEVLSPETAAQDRFQKRRLYQEQGVSTLWLIDPSQRVVEVWTPKDLFPTIETSRLTWHPAGAAEPLVIELASLFA